MIYNFFSKIFEKQISSKGLGVFRILFFTNLLFEIVQIHKFRNVYYDTIPYVQNSILSGSFIWYIWMTVLMFIILGYKTRYMSILNYVFLIAFIMPNGYYEYHMDYSYAGIGFLSIFVPLSKSYSIENLILRLKFSAKNKIYKPIEFTSQFYYFLLIIVSLGFVYFDSVYYKLTNVGWRSGLGMWLPASLPQITILNNQWMLNQKYLMLFLGYLTVFFEFIFPFIFWWKKARWTLLIIGMCLHTGILLEFPIPYFALGAIAIYFLMIPVKFWLLLENKIKLSNSKLTFYYDEDCPLCLRVKIIISFFDFFNAIEFRGVQSYGFNDKRLKQFNEQELLDNIYSIDRNDAISSGVDTYFKVFKYVPLFYLLLVFRLPIFYFLSKKIYQFIAKNRDIERCTFDNCMLPGETNKFINREELKIFKNIYVKDLKKALFFFLITFLGLLQLNVSLKSAGIIRVNDVFRASHRLLGITSHGVFVDWHFKDFKNIYALKYNGKFLPIIDENGMSSEYLKGGLWVNHNWRVNGPWVDVKDQKKRLENGLGRLVAFWSRSNGVNNPKFDFVVKKIDVPFKWERDLLTKNIESPWESIGTAVFKNKTGILKIDIR